MQSLYGEDETCLEFTNEEVMEYLVKPLEKHDDFKLFLQYEGFNLQKITEHLQAALEGLKGSIIMPRFNDVCQQPIDSESRITHIGLDGPNGKFFIVHYGHMIAVFILNEEFMFIDDLYREMQTTSETQGNIVYEGELRSLTHKEILELIYKFVILLKDSKKITIKEEEQEDRGLQFPKCNYEIELLKDIANPEKVQIENITFLIKNN